MCGMLTGLGSVSVVTITCGILAIAVDRVRETRRLAKFEVL